MAKGISLNIGLNSVDPNHYGGWDGLLNACEYDANDMAEIAELAGYKVTKLLTKEATVNNVKEQLTNASKSLESGDYLLLSYSGHGGQLEDLNNDEDDYFDETWCLYDRQFVDDELNVCLRDFKEGVRILVFSDSCHSGTVTKALLLKRTLGVNTINTNIGADGTKYRVCPDNILGRTYHQNKELYNSILKDPTLKEKEVKATVLLISGCQDNELSADGAYNGLFTSNLKRVWANGKFIGSHRKFHKQILNNMMNSDQHPKYFKEGKSNYAFEKIRPFSIL